LLKPILGAVLLLCAGTTRALGAPQEEDTWRHCGAPGEQVSIDACSAIIESGHKDAYSQAAAYKLRAQARLNSGDEKGAIADLTAAIDLEASNADVAESLFAGRGAVYVETGENDLAIADETAALAMQPDDATALGHLGNAYVGNHEFDKAAAAFTRAITIEPDSPTLTSNRAYAFLKLKRFDQAIADYDAVLKRTPDSALSLYGRGVAKRASGDTAGADSDIAAAEQLAPGIGTAFPP
jgi:tetratricopeptide (TPR) repeat protein